ncbi:MAG: hypothetical protein ACLFU6_02120 [Candidatus Hydrogenedentota bacterium]
MKWAAAVMLALALVVLGCQRTPAEVGNKVLSDFGMRERAEERSSAADRVFDRLDHVGQIELDRLNTQHRHGEIAYEEEGPLRGHYYKQRREYVDYRPVNVTPRGGSGAREKGDAGYIDYTYELYRSEPQNSRVEAQAATANMPTGATEKETLRYFFDSNGSWDGDPGEPTSH